MQAARRTAAAARRAEAVLSRTDTRAWVMQRRERTRQLIELGGLVQKAGLVELCGDDRAMLYGALLQLQSALVGERAAEVQAQARRRGKRAFELEARQGEDLAGGPA